MKGIVRFIRNIVKFIPTSLARRKFNRYVKSYYRMNRHKKVKYLQNYWSSNKYWDYFYHSLPHVAPTNKFVPADYYAINIEKAFDNGRYWNFTDEKNYYDKVFSNCNVSLPETYFRAIEGLLLDKQYVPVSISELGKKFSGTDMCIKGSLGSGGKQVIKTTFDGRMFIVDNQQYSWDDILKLFNNNLISQEIVKQSPFTAQFHPQSLNTFRMFSYRSVKTKNVHVTLAMLRMGTKRSFVDDPGVGGIAVGIDLEQGALMEYAFDQYGNYHKAHPDTKISFKGKKIPRFSDLVESVKQMANILTHTSLIGRDMVLSENNELLFTEPNIGTAVWMLQLANGKPLFGEFSDEVRDFVKNRRK